MADEPWHGTLNGYTNYRCRCAECTRAKADYQAEWRDRQSEKQIKDDPESYTPERRRRLAEDG